MASRSRNKPSDEILTTEQDLDEVIDQIQGQHNVNIPDKHRNELNELKGKSFEQVFATWNYGQHDYSEDEEERVKDFDQSHRLEIVWGQRSKCVNYLLAISFHLIVLLNFLYCLWESFGILAENSKLDYLYLEDVYQCLKIVPSHDVMSHFVSIFHAITCVAVFHAKTLQTANLCWAFLTGTVLHACFKVYEILFELRFTFDPKIRGHSYFRQIQLGVVLLVQLLAIIVILQRYYDLTAKFQTRAHKFVTQTYEGRQLNDRIIYRNVSSFVQRKYVLRSCTALQIYNTVQKMQVYKKKLRKGEEINKDLYNEDVQAAVQALKDVEGFEGMEMMRELKRRNYEHMNEELEVEIHGGGRLQGEEDTALTILEELRASELTTSTETKSTKK